MITGTPARRLWLQAHTRIDSALRPRTASAYKSKFDLYLAFATWMQLTLSSVESVICFLEFMAQQGSRAHTLMAYVSVMKHFFQLYDLDISVLDHRKIKLLIKSVSMNSVYTPKFKANFTPSLLIKIALACDSMLYGTVYKCVFLLAYFAFLRLSNLAPTSTQGFDPTRHILRGDVIFGPPGAHIIIKWAKAMQSSSKHQVVQIPLLNSSPICPVSALKSLISTIKAPPSSPLFMLPKPSGCVVLTAPMISATLSNILRSLSLNPAHYGFHCFRRSGVSWAADHNVPLQNLKAHGGWASNAISAYLQNTPRAASTVATTFQSLLST